MRQEIIKFIIEVVVVATVVAVAVFFAIVKPMLDQAVAEIEHDNWEQVENPKYSEPMKVNFNYGEQITVDKSALQGANYAQAGNY